MIYSAIREIAVLAKVLSIIVVGICVFPITGFSQPPQIEWVEGPNIVTLGKDVAEIAYDGDYLFAYAEDTIRAMEMIGNPSSGHEAGMIIPRSEESNWFIVFDYFPTGFVKDDDKDQIDSDALLETIQEATENANKIRREQGFPGFHVLGWHEEPHYDETTNNLVWSLLGESEGGQESGQVVNYNVRLLGRGGYMSVVLVTDPETLDIHKPDIDYIISNFAYTQGNTYAEFVQGDKVAKYGLAALVAGGAATAVAKTGFLKTLLKFGKFIIIAVVGFFAAIGRKLKSIFSGDES